MSALFRCGRCDWRSRPRPRCKCRVSPECLEPRSLMAGASPTDAAQYMLELINRARANPAAEGQRLLALAQSDPVIRRAVAGWDLAKFTRVISGYAPEPPLAFNPRLIDAALAESASMLAKNTQQHSPPGFLTNPAVAVANDGQAYYPTGSGSWATGENIFAYSASVAGSSMTRYVDYFEAGFLLDWGNPDFGHLKNILAPGPSGANFAAGVYPFNEIGVGLITGTPTAPFGPGNQGVNVGPALVTQEFGWRQGKTFLAGTFYNDADGNRFYTPGEGIGGVTVAAVGTSGQGTFRAQTWSTGGYSLQLPPGTYRVTATGNLPAAASKVVTIGVDNVAFGQGFATVKPKPPADIPVPGDYDGIGRAEFATYQPSTGNWSISNPTTGPRVKTFGMPGDIPVPGRYDGGTRTEPAVFRPSTATWYVFGPAGTRTTAFGGRGDVPVPGDYDGDGKTDLAVYRPSTGTWYVRRSRTQATQVTTFGIPGLDQPVPAAYDGGGVTEIAVLRPTTYQWFIIGPAGVRVVQFGGVGSIPVPAAYDGGGRAEIAVFQPSTSTYFVRDSGARRTLGLPGLEQPAPADYDGDGKVDPAVFRPSTADWTVKGSRARTILARFGQAGTAQTLKTLASASIPIPAAWAAWIPSPAAESGAGLGTAPASIRPPKPRGPLDLDRAR